MLFESLSWVMLTLTLLVALPGAMATAAPAKRSKKSISSPAPGGIYPAMEDSEVVASRDGDSPAAQAYSVMTVSKSSKTGRRVQTLGAPAAYVENDSVKPLAAGAPTKYEVVPAEKRAQIVQRMTLCQSLFAETGRAYDYRTMTTAQLQKELDAVHANERPVASAPDPILNPPADQSAANRRLE